MNFIKRKVFRIRTLIISTVLVLALPSCKAPDKDPVGAFNSLVKEYGFIGFQNPLEETKTGTMLSGRPTALAYIANYEDCFPTSEIERFYDRSNFQAKHEFNFKGTLGFLASGNPIVSAGAGITKNHYVQIELSGIVIEYMSSVDITRWYNNGLDDVCKSYLDQVGFIIQSISAQKLKLSITDSRGSYIKLDADNISKYFGINIGVEWNITDSYYVEIKTPKYIGYQLGSLRKENNGISLNRAMSTKKDRFIFETLNLFPEDIPMNNFRGISGVNGIDGNSIYLRK